MTAERFNSLEMKAKVKWIEKQLRGQKYGFFNSLLFKDKYITHLYQRSQLNPDIIVCTYAMAGVLDELSPDYEVAKQVLLGGRHCLNLILDGADPLKQFMQSGEGN